MTGGGGGGGGKAGVRLFVPAVCCCCCTIKSRMKSSLSAIWSRLMPSSANWEYKSESSSLEADGGSGESCRADNGVSVGTVLPPYRR